MSEIVGLYEIAAKAKVTTAAVTNWTKRYNDFPNPVTEVQAGKFYDSDQVEAWLRKRGKIMGAKVISLINLKGGVAKTTTTVGIATLLAGEYNKIVLVVDLDPQTNCTTMLIGEEKWKELDDNNSTLATLFEDVINETHNFDMDKTIQKNVSEIANVKHLDLIPSSLKMIDIQDRLATIPQGKFFSNNPTEIIKKALKPIINNYDYVLIDCPPNMGLITLNGLRISNGYIIPTIPDVLSTYGIPQIIKRVNEFSENIGEEIECLGIVATKVRGQSSLHSRTLDVLKRGKDAELFETIFYENNQMGEAAECVPVTTLRQKWGYQGQFDRFNYFVQEILNKMEV
ncbi:MAG: ParA family protein [Suipraeoptans sp.]